MCMRYCTIAPYLNCAGYRITHMSVGHMSVMLNMLAICIKQRKIRTKNIISNRIIASGWGRLVEPGKDYSWTTESSINTNEPLIYKSQVPQGNQLTTLIHLVYLAIIIVLDIPQTCEPRIHFCSILIIAASTQAPPYRITSLPLRIPEHEGAMTLPKRVKRSHWSWERYNSTLQKNNRSPVVP